MRIRFANPACGLDFAKGIAERSRYLYDTFSMDTPVTFPRPAFVYATRGRLK